MSSFSDAAVFIFPEKLGSPVEANFVQDNLFDLYNQEMEKWQDQFASLNEDQVAQKISKIIRQKNKSDLQKFYSHAKQLRTHLREFQENEVTALIRDMKEHPVVGEKAANKYDSDSKVGYCFGRAAYAHGVLALRGVHPINIAKVFAIGKLYRQNTSWDYHVATIARGPQGKWWVVDALTNKTLDLQKWEEEIGRWDRDALYPQIRFYITDASKFLPLPGAYAQKSMSRDFYRGFFDDVIRSFDLSSQRDRK